MSLLTLLGAGNSGIWTPASIPQAIFWLQTHSFSGMWSNGARTIRPAAPDDQVFAVVDPVSGLDINSIIENLRPFLRSDATRNGSLHFTLATGQRVLFANNSGGFFNNFHVGGAGAFLLWCKFDGASAAASEMMIDNANATSSNKGFWLFRNATTNTIELRLGLSGGSTGLILTSSTSIADTDWHRIIVKVAQGPNACSIQIDDGAIATATISGLTTGDASSPLFFGIRTGFSSPMNGQLSNVVICDGIPSDDDIDLWKAYNPPLA